MKHKFTLKFIKVNESQYKQCGGNPTLFHRARSIEKILKKDKYWHNSEKLFPPGKIYWKNTEKIWTLTQSIEKSFFHRAKSSEKKYWEKENISKNYWKKILRMVFNSNQLSFLIDPLTTKMPWLANFKVNESWYKQFGLTLHFSTGQNLLR